MLLLMSGINNLIKPMKLLNKYKTSELFRGVTAITLWQGSSKILLVLATLYCSNLLSPNDFGVYSFVKNTLNLIVMMCATNFSGLCTKFATESLSSESSLRRLYLLFIFTLCISVIFGIFVFLVPSHSINDFLASGDIASYMRIIALFLPIFILQPLFSGVLLGYKEFSLVGKYDFFSSLTFCALLVTGIYFLEGQGAIIALFCYYFFYSIAGIFIITKYNREHHYLTKIDNIASEKHTLYTMIIPVFVMSFVEVPIGWMGQALIAHYDEISSVGVMTVVTQIRTFALLLPTYFFNSLSPFIIKLNQEKNYIEYFGKYTIIFKVLFTASFALFAVLALSGNLILSIFNRSYVAYYSAYLVGIALLPLQSVQILYKINLVIREHQIAMLIMVVVSGVALLGSLLFLLELGVNSLVAFFISQIIQYIVQVAFCVGVFAKDKRKCLNSERQKL